MTVILRKERLKYWLVSVLLMLPVVWPILRHYLIKKDDLLPTGFIQPDMPYYMGNAREYFDAASYHLFYANPSGYSYDAPVIYFQPLTLLFGLLWRLTGLDPGVVFIAVGIIAAICCMRVALTLYRELVGLETRAQWLGFLVFCWGGGLLALAGFAYNLLTHQTQKYIFRFDPVDGWWFLNFGRNLVYPTESVYHALFLACIYFIVKSRYTAALALAWLLSISHPFTGIELLAIITAWAFLEIFFMENRQVPRAFFYGCCLLIAFHVGYYIVYLNRFPEHRMLVQQWSLPWLLQAKNFLPAYVLVGGLAIWTVRRFPLAKEYFSRSRNRLLLVWFLVAFTLANHEFAINPIQPLHFTRGYIWMPLFLMGAPTLVKLLEHLLDGRRKTLGLAGAVLIIALLLSDNIIWFATLTMREDQNVWVTRDEQQLYRWLDSDANRGFVVLSQNRQVGFLTIVYTPLRSWVAHWANTPQRETREIEQTAFFQEAIFLDRWRSLPLLVVFSNSEGYNERAVPAMGADAQEVFRNPSFTVFRVAPKPNQ